MDISPPQSTEEINLLVELRELISNLDLSSDDLEDKNLVRFLRARKGNLKHAELMIRNHFNWKIEENIKCLLAEYEIPKGWDEAFPYDLSGFDRTGSPIFFAALGKWDVQKETDQGNKEEFLKFVYFTLEKLLAFQKHLSKDERDLKKGVGIVDMKGLSLRQVTSVDTVEVMIRSVKVVEANFPEAVKAVVVINAPWPFQIIWKMVKHFISEETHSKLYFLGSDMGKCREALLELAEPDQFPACYGGTAPNYTTYFIGRDGSWRRRSENQNETTFESFDC